MILLQIFICNLSSIIFILSHFLLTDRFHDEEGKGGSSTFFYIKGSKWLQMSLNLQKPGNVISDLDNLHQSGHTISCELGLWSTLVSSFSFSSF